MSSDTRPGPPSTERRSVLDRFLRLEMAQGVLLLFATLLAVVWANSPWSSTYDALWRTPLSLGIGSFATSRALHFFINDVLMVAFFLVVGLEIRRELTSGELADMRRAALPIACALGGMAVPACTYLLVSTAASRRGW